MGLSELNAAYIDMLAQDRQTEKEERQKLLMYTAVVLGIMTGGLGGFPLLVAEGVVANEGLADIGVIMGTGFAPFLGGPLKARKDGKA